MMVQVAVCGPAQCTEPERQAAYRIGELLATRGAVVLCGGGTGVMAAVAAGARTKDGLVIGVLPTSTRTGAGPDLSAAIATNMGQARNAVIVQSADVVIVVGGSWGTLSELALAMRRGVPVVALGGWRVVDASGTAVPGVLHADSAEDAVELALSS